jgi:hypothetical protein
MVLILLGFGFQEENQTISSLISSFLHEDISKDQDIVGKDFNLKLVWKEHVLSTDNSMVLMESLDLQDLPTTKLLFPQE